MVVQFDEQLLMTDDFTSPGILIERLNLVEFFLRIIKAFPFDVRVLRHPADGSLPRLATALRAVDDPLQHAHVFAEPRPHELAFGILAEPVHMIDLWSFTERPP